MTLLEKGQVLQIVFIGGAKAQLKQEWTWGAATLVGLQQGLKYKGSIKVGVKNGVAVLGVLAVVNGVYNIVQNWDGIKEIFKKET